MLKWGDTEINLIQDTYDLPGADAGMTEIELLPNPDGSYATVIQQGPRSRRRVSWRGWVASQAEIEAFQGDYYAGQVREFTGYDNVSFHALIFSFSPGNRYFQHYIEYSIVLIEATPPEEPEGE